MALEHHKGNLRRLAPTRKLDVSDSLYERQCLTNDLGAEDATIFRGSGSDAHSLEKGERVLLGSSVVAILVGTAVGAVLNPVLTQPKHAHYLLYLQFPGELFLRMLQLMIVPLVISSNVSSAATVRGSRWLAGLSILYYLTTTLAAVLIATTLAILIRPGQHYLTIHKQIYEPTSLVSQFRADHAIYSALDLIRNMVPKNPVEATFSRSRTAYSILKQAEVSAAAEVEEEDASVFSAFNATEYHTNRTIDDITKAIEQVDKRSDERVRGANILGLICFSLFFGLGIRKLLDNDREDVHSVLHFFTGLRRIMVYLISIVIWFSPVGIMSLIASQVSQTEDLRETVAELGMYTMTVMVGLLLHVLCVLSPILFFLGRRNPVKFFYHMLQAVMIAGGTASSMATLPVTANCLEHNVKLDNRVMRFMLPLGTTVNMDGTALYQTVAIIYLAQGMQVNLEAGTLVFIMVLVVMSSIVTASVPSAGFVSMILTLQAIGMPEESAKIVMAVDWFLDRLRTPVNVLSNAVGVAVVAERCRSKLDPPQKKSAAVHVTAPLASQEKVQEDVDTAPSLDSLPRALVGPSCSPRLPDVLPFQLDPAKLLLANSASPSPERKIRIVETMLDFAFIDEPEETLDNGHVVVRF